MASVEWIERRHWTNDWRGMQVNNICVKLGVFLTNVRLRICAYTCARMAYVWFTHHSELNTTMNVWYINVCKLEFLKRNPFQTNSKNCILQFKWFVFCLWFCCFCCRLLFLIEIWIQIRKCNSFCSKINLRRVWPFCFWYS